MGRSTRWAIRAGSVFDGQEALPGAWDIVIDGERIESLRSTGGPIPTDAQVIEGVGTWVCPGLIDTHVHSTFISEMGCYLRNGVTSIRYAGNRREDVEAVRSAVAANGEPAPRVFSCGPMIDGEPPSYPELSEVAKTPDAARGVVRRLVASGEVDSLLAVQQVTAEVLSAIVDEAHGAGLPVFGQLWRVDGAEASRIGIDQLDNTSRVFVSEAPESELVHPGGVASRIAMWRRGWATVDWDRTRELMDVMLEHHVAYCPTLIRALWAAGSGAGTEEHLAGDRDAHLFGEDEHRAWRERLGRGRDRAQDEPGISEAWEATLEALFRWIVMFRSSGGAIVVGTDCQFGGILLHDELEALGQAGLSRLEVLVAATGAAGTSLGRGDLIGCIRPGALADLVQVRSDPLADLRTLRDPVRVVIGGEVVHGQGRE